MQPPLEPCTFAPEPFVLTLSGRCLAKRFFAHLLIRLLVLGPLPPQLQAQALVFPFSLLPPLPGMDRACLGESRPGAGAGVAVVLNGNGSPLEIHEPLGKSTLMTWSATDIFKESETDANLRLTTYGYDGNANLTRETILNPDQTVAAETLFDYDPLFNKLTYKKDAEGRETFYGIDSRGDLQSMTDAVGNVTQYEYDAGQPGGPGLLTKVTDPRGNEALHSGHDSFGHATLVTDPLGNATQREYDARGRLTDEQDSLGRHKAVEYDGLDRVRKETRYSGGPSGNEDTVVERLYYPGGEPKQEKNPNGSVTTYTLDGLNRVTGSLTEGPGFTPLSTSISYDENGNKQAETDRRGVKREYVYDALNRLKEVRILTGVIGEGPIGTVATYDYDPVGNKLFETDVSNNRTDFEYDTLYRVRKKLLAESGPTGDRYFEEYAYDRVGNTLTSKDANGKVTSFEYDGLNRGKTTVRDVGGLNLTSRAEYDDPEGSHVNKSAELDEARGLRTEYTYDPLNRELTRNQILLKDDEGNPVAPDQAVTYLTSATHDDAAHSVAVTDPESNVTVVAMDGMDRVVTQTVDPSGLNLTTHTTYDGLGQRKTVTDARGNDTVHENDGLGRLTKVTDAALKDTLYSYDGEGLKISETDRRGVLRTFTYDNLGRPRKTVLVPSLTGVPWSHETQYQDAARKRVEIDARLTPTTFDLDKLGRVVKETDVYLKFRVVGWDGVNRRSETDKRGHTTSFEYDGVNRLTKVTDPVPFQDQTVETTYLDVLNRVQEKDRQGTFKLTQSDPLGRVVSVTRAGVPLERNAYDGNGNKTLAQDAEGRKTHFDYDHARRLVSRIDGFESPVAGTTRFEYDENGNKTKEFDPRSVYPTEPSMRYEYDVLNRVTDAFDGEDDHTQYDYDLEGNRTLVHEPGGQETTYLYDELGKLRTVTQPAVPAGIPETVYTYDANRNRVRQEDANQHVVEMSYDLLDRLDLMTQQGAPEGDLVTDHDYDENGNKTLLTDPKGQTATSTYDELNRLKTKAYAFAPGDSYRPWRHTTGMVYGYDLNGNVTGIDESVASGTDPPVVQSTIRGYDLLDRLQSEATPLPDDPAQTRTVGYGYYLNGLRKTVTDPDGLVTFYSYDGRNRLETATTAFGTPGAQTTSYTYWPDDLLQTIAYPNGVGASHVYDKADRLTSLSNANGPTVVSSYGYGYDQNGNRLTQAETNGGLIEATSYTYDDLNRLETVMYPADATYANGRRVAYGYDLAGNRESELTTDPLTSATLASKTGTFDAVNRLTVLTDNLDPAQTVTFGWDKNGNQTSKQVGPGTPTLFRYDIRDKLAEAQEGTSGPILGRHQYDFDGRRTKKIGEEGIRQYVYDQTSLLAEYDEAGLPKAKYDYSSDRLISLFRADEGRRYFSLDGLRSVVNLTDDTGSAVASYHWTAWGEPRFPAELDASKNRFSFTGYLLDRETGFHYAKARYYDSALGRFTSQDSFLGQVDDPPSLHRYFYANDNPTRYIDPTGHANFQLTGYLPIDPEKGEYIPTATEDVTVYANPTLAQLREQVDLGELDPGVAAVRGAGVIMGVLHGKPDYEKSYARNFVEETVGNAAETLAAPGLKTYEGLARQDVGLIGLGLAETAAAGAIPLVVKEGAPVLIDKAIEKAPWLAKDVRELGAQGLEGGRAVLEGATEGAKRLLKAELEFDPTVIGSNAANIKLRLPPKAPRGGIGPVLKGRAGEALSEAEAVAAGETVRGRQVTFELPSGRRTRPDLLTERTSDLKVREAKHGPSAELTPGQQELQGTIQGGGTVIPRGANAEKAGLAPGAPIKLQTFEEDRF